MDDAVSPAALADLLGISTRSLDTRVKLPLRVPFFSARWFWTVLARVPQQTHDRGYAATRDDAMGLKAAWRA
jgi:hypothetical protein